MKGLICLWSGAIVDIPAGWGLCDGSLGTPDLRNRFLVGAGSTYAVGASGGTLTHTHPFTASPHNHSIPGGAGLADGTDLDLTTTDTASTGTTNPTNHLPPYFALCYIMKL